MKSYINGIAKTLAFASVVLYTASCGGNSNKGVEKLLKNKPNMKAEDISKKLKIDVDSVKAIINDINAEKDKTKSDALKKRLSELGNELIPKKYTTYRNDFYVELMNISNDMIRENEREIVAVDPQGISDLYSKVNSAFHDHSVKIDFESQRKYSEYLSDDAGDKSLQDGQKSAYFVKNIPKTNIQQIYDDVIFADTTAQKKSYRLARKVYGKTPMLKYVVSEIARRDSVEKADAKRLDSLASLVKDTATKDTSKSKK